MTTHLLMKTLLPRTQDSLQLCLQVVQLRHLLLMLNTILLPLPYQAEVVSPLHSLQLLLACAAVAVVSPPAADILLWTAAAPPTTQCIPYTLFQHLLRRNHPLPSGIADKPVQGMLRMSNRLLELAADFRYRCCLMYFSYKSRSSPETEVDHEIRSTDYSTRVPCRPYAKIIAVTYQHMIGYAYHYSGLLWWLQPGAVT